MHNTTSLASETSDGSVKEIHHPHKELTSKTPVINCFSSDQQEMHANLENRNRTFNQCTRYGTNSMKEIDIPNGSDPRITPANSQDRQPIPTCITQRMRPKINPKKLTRKHNKRYKNSTSHDEVITREDCKSEWGFSCAYEAKKQAEVLPLLLLDDVQGNCCNVHVNNTNVNIVVRNDDHLFHDCSTIDPKPRCNLIPLV